MEAKKSGAIILTVNWCKISLCRSVKNSESPIATPIKKAPKTARTPKYSVIMALIRQRQMARVITRPIFKFLLATESSLLISQRTTVTMNMANSKTKTTDIIEPSFLLVFIICIMMENNTQPKKSSIIADVTTRLPILVLKISRSINILVITDRAVIDNAVPKNKAVINWLLLPVENMRW